MYKPRTGKSAGDISTLPVFTADFANILLALKLIIRCADVARAWTRTRSNQSRAMGHVWFLSYANLGLKKRGWPYAWNVSLSMALKNTGHKLLAKKKISVVLFHPAKMYPDHRAKRNVQCVRFDHATSRCLVIHSLTDHENTEFYGIYAEWKYSIEFKTGLERSATALVRDSKGNWAAIGC